MHPPRQSENLDRLVTDLVSLVRPGETVLGLGNDIAEVRRIAALINRLGSRFLTRSFTPAEIADADGKARPAIHFAGKWAAKEAVYKALNLRWNRPFSWKEIEVLSPARGGTGQSREGVKPGFGGPPRIKLSGQIREQLRAAQPEGQNQSVPRFLVSISHCDEYAFAVALAVIRDAEPNAEPASARIFPPSVSPEIPPVGDGPENP